MNEGIPFFCSKALPLSLGLAWCFPPGHSTLSEPGLWLSSFLICYVALVFLGSSVLIQKQKWIQIISRSRGNS